MLRVLFTCILVVGAFVCLTDCSEDCRMTLEMTHGVHLMKQFPGSNLDFLFSLCTVCFSETKSFSAVLLFRKEKRALSHTRTHTRTHTVGCVSACFQHRSQRSTCRASQHPVSNQSATE